MEKSRERCLGLPRERVSPDPKPSFLKSKSPGESPACRGGLWQRERAGGPGRAWWKWSLCHPHWAWEAWRGSGRWACCHSWRNTQLQAQSHGVIAGRCQFVSLLDEEASIPRSCWQRVMVPGHSTPASSWRGSQHGGLLLLAPLLGKRRWREKKERQGKRKIERREKREERGKEKERDRHREEKERETGEGGSREGDRTEKEGESEPNLEAACIASPPQVDAITSTVF